MFNDEVEVIEAVAEKLKSKGFKAAMEYPGYIAILRRDRMRRSVHQPAVLYKWGTANETWMADLYDPYDDNEYGAVATSVPSTSTDVNAIVAAIIEAMEEEE